MKKMITIAPPVILPRKYIKETSSDFPYSTSPYSTSTNQKPV